MSGIEDDSNKDKDVIEQTLERVKTHQDTIDEDNSLKKNNFVL